jgi:uncharacterized double-CXXCG motif protein
MRFFQAKPDDANWGRHFKYMIDATHMWRLPGLKCEECGTTWATTGLAYPAIDLSPLPLVARYYDPNPVTQEEFELLRLPILRLMPRGSKAPPPGTEFGPLLGRARGTYGSFAWVNPWTLLAQKETISLLTSEGIRLPLSVPTGLTFRGKASPDLLELQIEPSVELTLSSFALSELPPCSACGRDIRHVDHVVIDSSSISTVSDIFRVQELPTLILASERFVKTAQSAHLTDIIFHEVETSN